jgi:hypothetical protein
MKRADRSGEEVPVQTKVLKFSEDRWRIVVEAPHPLPVEGPNPHHQGIRHALLRPYEKVTQQGNPIVGSVQYHLTQLPHEEFPRVLFSVATREESSPNEPPLLPGNIFLFPGIPADQEMHQGETTGQIHHVSVREKDDDRVQAYSNVRADDDQDGEQTIRVKQTEGVEEYPSMVHLCQLWVHHPDALDPAGLADAEISPAGIKSAIDREALSPDPTVENHGCDSLEIDPAIKETDHFLWAGFVLADQLPTEDQGLALADFLLRNVAPGAKKAPTPNLEYDSDVFFKFKAIDLSAVGSDAKYRYLVSLKGIVPGSMNTPVSFAAFPHPRPVKELYGLD